MAQVSGASELAFGAEGRLESKKRNRGEEKRAQAFDAFPGCHRSWRATDLGRGVLHTGGFYWLLFLLAFIGIGVPGSFMLQNAIDQWPDRQPNSKGARPPQKLRLRKTDLNDFLLK